MWAQVVYLVKELLQTKESKLDALRAFVPDAHPEDWTAVWAGQRVQIMKKDPKKVRATLRPFHRAPL